jgi:hypothetical protein
MLVSRQDSGTMIGDVMSQLQLYDAPEHRIYPHHGSYGVSSALHDRNKHRSMPLLRRAYTCAVWPG